MTAKIPVFIIFQGEGYNTIYPVYQNAVVSGDTTEYQISAYDFSSGAELTFTAESEDGYPVHSYV